MDNAREPGKQFVNARDRMAVGDAGEDVAQPGFRVEAVELGGADERVHRRGAVAAGVGAGEGPVPAAQRDAAQRVLGDVVVRLQPGVVEEARQGGATV
jgi:hypothetical protein